ncbi:MAG: hypothetical protein ACK56I_29800, partial [bacterium]
MSPVPLPPGEGTMRRRVRPAAGPSDCAAAGMTVRPPVRSASAVAARVVRDCRRVRRAQAQAE